jgi:hypothetical protein
MTHKPPRAATQTKTITQSTLGIVNMDVVLSTDAHISHTNSN